MPDALVITLAVIAGLVVLVLLLQLTARSRSRALDRQVWGPIERAHGPQQRRVWIEVHDRTATARAAVSDQAFHLVVGQQVIAAEWADLSELAYADQGFTVRIAEGETSRKPAFRFAVGGADHPLNRLFLDAFIERYETSR